MHEHARSSNESLVFPPILVDSKLGELWPRRARCKGGSGRSRAIQTSLFWSFDSESKFEAAPSIC